jgi:hypothetical protein
MRRLHLALDEGDGGAREALIRAFLWLKKRVEEQQSDGLLAISSPALFDNELKDALGPLLAELLRDEGKMSLGDGLAIVWRIYEDLPAGGAGPIVAIAPPVEMLERLRVWDGDVLIAAGPGEATRAWVSAQRAEAPRAEDYMRLARDAQAQRAHVTRS